MGLPPPPDVRAVLDAVAAGVLVVDPHGTVTDANAAALDRCIEPPVGLPVDRVSWSGEPDVEVRALDGGWSVVVSTPAPDERRALAALLEQIPASVARLGHDLRIEQVSDLWLLATGRTREEVTGVHLGDLGLPSRIADELIPLVDRVLRSGKGERLEALIPTPIGLRWVEFVFVAERDRLGIITHVLGVSTDVTHRKNRELSLAREAATDALTGVLNRAGLNDELQRRAGEPAWVGTALLVIDLDGFKQINDAHGHLVGDQILVEVARRLQATAGETNPVARLGGDEFVVIEPEPAGAARALADALVDAVRTPLPVDGGTAEHAVGLSIGVARVRSAGEDPTSLFTRADEAMYQAKRAGAPVVVAP